MQELQNLSLESIPQGWRPRISLAMARRDATVQSIRSKLEDTFFLMAWNRDKLDPKELDAAREMFPETVLVRGLKNSLVRKAMEGTGWESFAEALKGNNMYVFVMEDTDVKPTINAYIKMERKFRRKDTVAKVYEKIASTTKFKMQPLVGGCIRGEWQTILPEDIPKLKDFATKVDLIAKIAGGIKQVPTKLARSTKQVSQKLAIGAKKIVEKMEEQGKSKVSDIVA